MPTLAEASGLVSLLRHPNAAATGGAITTGGGGFLRALKLLPLISSSCKLLSQFRQRPRRAALLLPSSTASSATITLFGHRRGRVNLCIQETPTSSPLFLLELPLLTSALHREMSSGLVKIALECEASTRANYHGRRRPLLTEELSWTAYCNGRKVGYAVQRVMKKNKNNYNGEVEEDSEEMRVVKMLRGVSMGAGVLPAGKTADPEKEAATSEGEMTYMRARFERVVGSKDSEAYYMINPDGGGGPELSIFLVRVK